VLIFYGDWSFYMRLLEVVVAGLLLSGTAIAANTSNTDQASSKNESTMEKAKEKVQQVVKKTTKQVKEGAAAAKAKMRRANQRKIKTTVTVKETPQRKDPGRAPQYQPTK
jgi:outer membrane murein-binding lipoprotein Lpp